MIPSSVTADAVPPSPEGKAFERLPLGGAKWRCAIWGPLFPKRDPHIIASLSNTADGEGERRVIAVGADDRIDLGR